MTAISNAEPRLIASAGTRQAPGPRAGAQVATQPPHGTIVPRKSATFPRSRGARFGVALLAVAVSLVVRLIVGKVIDDRGGPFLFFTPAVMIAAWYGGTGPGLLATLVSVFVADYFLLLPRGRFSYSNGDIPNIVVFMLVGAQISWLSGALYRSKRRAESDAELARQSEQSYRTLSLELDWRVRQRTSELQFQTSLLQAQSNASRDGILVVSTDGRVIFRNRRLLDLWELPADAVSGSIANLIAVMRTRLSDHQHPLGDADVLADPESEQPISLQFEDGRTLECYSASVRDAEGYSYGRVWYFHDVTERRRVAKQILEASERERQRIGQDLHDDLCQHLAGITFLGRVLQQKLESRMPAEAEAAAHIVDLLEGAVRRARDLARGLQPPLLETAGLGPALQELASNVQSMFRVLCHVECEHPLPLSDSAAPLHLYRIVQEATNNAIRHGKARNIYIDVVRVGGRVILTVEDDGVGINDEGTTEGLGLRTMRHRARMIGALLTVARAEVAGTIVTCQLTIPLLPEPQIPAPETHNHDSTPDVQSANSAG